LVINPASFGQAQYIGMVSPGVGSGLFENIEQFHQSVSTSSPENQPGWGAGTSQ